MRSLAALVLAAVALSACGGSSQNGRIISVCHSTRGQTIGSPVTGSIVGFGRPPVLVRVDNTGNLNAGQLVLGKTDYPGWLAMKTFFFTPPSFRGGFVVEVQAIDGSSAAGIGMAPPGRKFKAKAGPAAETSHGWREWPAFTWVKGAGCYRFTISGKHVHETVTLAALG